MFPLNESEGANFSKVTEEGNAITESHLVCRRRHAYRSKMMSKTNLYSMVALDVNNKLTLDVNVAATFVLAHFWQPTD